MLVCIALLPHETSAQQPAYILGGQPSVTTAAPGASPRDPFPLASPTRVTSGPCFITEVSCEFDRSWFATLYFDRKAAGDLLQIAADVARADVRFDRQYFVGEGLSYVLLHDIHIPIPFSDQVAAHNRLEIEGQLDQHFGIGTDVEAVVALIFRTGDIPLFGGLSFNVALGDGPSICFTRPQGETGHRHFLNYITAEIELTSTLAPWLHLVPQVHHRSAAYGVIAPTPDSSNFLGFGLRMDLN